METKALFTIQASYVSGHWEPIDNAEYETLAEAEAGMEDLEQNLGWRNMRIVDSEGDVYAYGLEREEGDENA